MNRELAATAVRMGRTYLTGSPATDTARRGCFVAAVALRYTTTVKAARKVVEQHPMAEDIRQAALTLIDQLTERNES